MFSKVVINKAEIFHTKHYLGSNIHYNSFSLSLLWQFTHKIWLFTMLIFVCEAYKVSLNNMKYTVAENQNASMEKRHQPIDSIEYF